MDARDEFEVAARALRAGEIGQGEFARRTRGKWTREARRLFARYRRKLPCWVEVADLEQELQILALKHVAAWDPARAFGKPIGLFVTWATIHRAQRVIDHWRGASLHGAHNRAPSRAEVAFSRAFGPDVDPMARADRATPAGQEGAVESGEEFAAALASTESVREALVLLFLRRAQGSARLAAVLLYGSFAARVECELRDEAHARRVVGESVRAIADRMSAEEIALPPDDLFAEDADEGEETEEMPVRPWDADGYETTEDRAERAA